MQANWQAYDATPQNQTPRAIWFLWLILGNCHTQAYARVSMALGTNQFLQAALFGAGSLAHIKLVEERVMPPCHSLSRPVPCTILAATWLHLPHRLRVRERFGAAWDVWPVCTFGPCRRQQSVSSLNMYVASVSAGSAVSNKVRYSYSAYVRHFLSDWTFMCRELGSGLEGDQVACRDKRCGTATALRSCLAAVQL